MNDEDDNNNNANENANENANANAPEDAFDRVENANANAPDDPFLRAAAIFARLELELDAQEDANYAAFLRAERLELDANRAALRENQNTEAFLRAAMLNNFREMLDVNLNGGVLEDQLYDHRHFLLSIAHLERVQAGLVEQIRRNEIVLTPRFVDDEDDEEE